MMRAFRNSTTNAVEESQEKSFCLKIFTRAGFEDVIGQKLLSKALLSKNILKGPEPT